MAGLQSPPRRGRPSRGSPPPAKSGGYPQTALDGHVAEEGSLPRPRRRRRSQFRECGFAEEGQACIRCKACATMGDYLGRMRSLAQSSTSARTGAAQRLQASRIALTRLLMVAALGLVPAAAHAQSPMIQGWLAANTACKGGAGRRPQDPKSLRATRRSRVQAETERVRLSGGRRLVEMPALRRLPEGARLALR